MATLWLKVGQDDQPPASVPSTLLPPKHCPQCNQELAPPLKTSGRQVCLQCGWASQPRQPAANPTAKTLPEPDLLRLLEQAASESMENMRPRKTRKDGR